MKTLALIAALALALSTNAANYGVSATPTSPLAGETTKVSWTTPPGVTIDSDWVGIYPAGYPLSVTRLFDIPFGRVAGTNSLSFDTAGDFVLQYFTDPGTVALSPPVPFTIRITPEAFSLSVSTNSTTVGAQLLTTWQSATNLNVSNDQVGYYNENDPTRLVSYISVDGRHQGSAYFSIGRPGRFKFGYFKAGKIANLVTPLSTVDVVPPKTMTIQKVGNSWTVRWYEFSIAQYQLRDSATLGTPVSTWRILVNEGGVGGWHTYTLQSPDPTHFFVIQETWPQ